MTGPATCANWKTRSNAPWLWKQASEFPSRRCPTASATIFQESIPGAAQQWKRRQSLPQEGLNLEEHIQQIERSYLLAALERSGGVRTQAADLLKMSYRSFRHYAKKYGV